jgi:hypothetical protein
LIDAVRERHETPIAQHRLHLLARLPGPEDRTTRQLVEAYVQPLAAEMLRCASSYWARLPEMLLVDQPLRFSRGIEPAVRSLPRQRADTAASDLLELMAAHLSRLPEAEAVARVALTVRFASGGLARWERDSQADVEGVAPLAPFTLILTDLAVAMLDAPSSVPPQIDADLPHSRLAGQQALPGRWPCGASHRHLTLTKCIWMITISSFTLVPASYVRVVTHSALRGDVMTDHNDSPRDDRPWARRWLKPRHAARAGLMAGVALLAVAALPAAALAGTAPPAAAVTGHQVASAAGASVAAQRTVAFWTRSRMLSARDADTIKTVPGSSAAVPARASGLAGQVAGTGPEQALADPFLLVHVPASDVARPEAGPVGSPWTGNPGLPPATTTGKVFFTTHNGEEWVCSASTVNSSGRDAVITAGHCVYGSLGGEVPGEGWHTNWIFVPGYSNGSAPHGVWTAKKLSTLTSYYDNQDEGDDIGAAVMNVNSTGQHIVAVLGGQGFAWNWASDQYVYDLGYPAAAPFNGLTLQYCNGSEFSWSAVASTMGLRCNFTGGSSGGPWLMDFGGEWGYINGVNDFGYTSLPGYIFSAYFGNNADALYNSVASL